MFRGAPPLSRERHAEQLRAKDSDRGDGTLSFVGREGPCDFDSKERRAAGSGFGLTLLLHRPTRFWQMTCAARPRKVRHKKAPDNAGAFELLDYRED